MPRKPHYQVSVDGSDTEAINRLRIDAVAHYGGKCYFCDETDPKTLLLRPQRQNGQLGTLYWVRSHGYPETMDGKELLLVCGNCKVRRKRV